MTRLLGIGITSWILMDVGQAHAMCFERETNGERELCCPGQDQKTFSCTKVPRSKPPKPELSCTVYELNGTLQECCSPVGRPAERKCGRPGWSKLDCAGPDDPKCFDTSGPGEWDHGRRNRLNVEVIPTVVGGARRMTDSTGNAEIRVREGLVGFEVKARLLYRWQPSGSATAKILAIIPFIFIGNDFGLEVRAGTFGIDTAGGWRAGGFVAARPALLVSFDRFRAFALLNIIPEVGVRKVEGSPVGLHLAVRVPLSVMLSRHVGLEAELGAGLFQEIGLSGGLGVIVR